MREIKFRAWDTAKQMMSGSPLALTINKKRPYLLKQRAMDQQWEGTATHGYILMQFTGLHDKNGKDVFEGDIVICAGMTKKCPHIVEWRQELGGEFGGGMPGWYLSELRSGFGKGYAWMGTEEIIGNKWENPELLKDTLK